MLLHFETRTTQSELGWKISNLFTPKKLAKCVSHNFKSSPKFRYTFDGWGRLTVWEIRLQHSTL